MIDPGGRISSPQAYVRVSRWIENYSGGERVHLVSAGLGSDLLLLFELWKHSQPGMAYFHALHCLPRYLNHAQHFDLNTLLFLAGADPDKEREAYLGRPTSPLRHNALHDAQVVRDCFLQLAGHRNLQVLGECLSR
jgi:hypothetical protein